MKEYLRSKDDGAFLQKEREVTSKIKASGKPPSGRHVKLGASFISKRLEIEDGILEGKGVQCYTISNSTKLWDGHTVWSWF